jgi:hypothetical protein
MERSARRAIIARSRSLSADGNSRNRDEQVCPAGYPAKESRFKTTETCLGLDSTAFLSPIPEPNDSLSRKAVGSRSSTAFRQRRIAEKTTDGARIDRGVARGEFGDA